MGSENSALKLDARKDLRTTKTGKEYRIFVAQDAHVDGVWGNVFALADSGIVGFELKPVYAKDK